MCSMIWQPIATAPKDGRAVLHDARPVCYSLPSAARSWLHVAHWVEHLPLKQAVLGETLDLHGDSWQATHSGCGILDVPMPWAHGQASSILATQICLPHLQRYTSLLKTERSTRSRAFGPVMPTAGTSLQTSGRHLVRCSYLLAHTLIHWSPVRVRPSTQVLVAQLVRAMES